MSWLSSKPAPPLNDSDAMCLRFLADVGTLSEAEQSDLRVWWLTFRQEDESVAQFLVRQGVFHQRLLEELEASENGRTSRAMLSLLFTPVGWDILENQVRGSHRTQETATTAAFVHTEPPAADTVRTNLNKCEQTAPASPPPAPDEAIPPDERQRRQTLADAVKKSTPAVSNSSAKKDRARDTVPDLTLENTPLGETKPVLPSGEEHALPSTEPLKNLPLIKRKRGTESLFTHSSQLREGMTFGAYRLVKLLGRGSLGLVYEAVDLLLGRSVAVKIIAPEMAGRGSAWTQRFLQQARLASTIDHPLILSGFSIGQQRGLYFYAMPLIRGGSAKDRLKADGPFAPADATSIMRQAAQALHVAHGKGLAHGNLKPSNIFLSEDGTVRVTDFSVAPVPSAQGKAPPARDEDVATDIRLLGATYHWLLTGRPPSVVFEERTNVGVPPQREATLPPACTRIIAMALARDNAHGFIAAEEMAEALTEAEELLAGNRPNALCPADDNGDPKQGKSGKIALANATHAKKQVQAGQVLGKYLLTEKIGQGSSGVVFRAKHQTLNIPVAVKVLHITGESLVYRQLASEARLLAQLNHPHIVRVWDFEDDPALPYMVMEYVEGMNLAELIQQSGRLPPPPAVQIIGQVADALGAAHRLGIIHRDVKPGNVLLANDGTAKLADLGLAVFLDGEQSKLKSQGLAGTVAYMPPEQAMSAGAADHRSDIYSLGASFYHLVTGQLPFQGATRMEVILKHAKQNAQAPHELVPDLPPQMSDVILKMLAKDPAQRYQTYDELLQALYELNALVAAAASNTAPRGQPDSGTFRPRFGGAGPSFASPPAAEEAARGGQ